MTKFAEMLRENVFLKACLSSMLQPINARTFLRTALGVCFSYRGGLVLASMGHHADTSQVLFSLSNFTHDPV